MANTRLIKRRIRSAKNIAQITKAMQMVAASKMKKAQNLALSGRPYAEKIAEVVREVVARVASEKHPLLKHNPTGKRLIILISTNKGLCGGLNTNLFRSIAKWLVRDQLDSADFVTLGNKGESFVVRSHFHLTADFSETMPFTIHISALTTLVTDSYLRGEYKEVYVVYNNFINALRQEPTVKRILPIAELVTSLEVKEAEKKPLEFKIEPSLDEILDPLLFHYLENLIRDAVYEAEASEHSARMIAMKNATDNAKELIEVLTLEFNKARQEKITYEISDIVTARLAVE